MAGSWNLSTNYHHIAKKLRKNLGIRSKTIRLIGPEDEQLGIVAIEKALGIAREQGLDLVEVAPNASPSVCRVMDYGKYLYRQAKNEQKHKAKQKKHEVKGIRVSMRTDVHDMDVKVKRARKFIEEGNSLKVQLIFRGREITHFDLAKDKMEYIKDQLKDLAKVDQEPKKQGHNLIMILSPLR